MIQEERKMVMDAKMASRTLAIASADQRSKALKMMAKHLRLGNSEILSANAQDLEDAKKNNAEQKRIRIMTLSAKDIQDMADFLDKVSLYCDPVGYLLESEYRQDGLKREKRFQPLGVVAMVYEARPSVVTDGAALCLRTGNALVLRCSSLCMRTDTAIVSCLKAGIKEAGLDAAVLTLLARPDHKLTDELAQMDRFVDLMIVRGGYQALCDVKRAATIPVLGAGPGNCHIYIDASAKTEMAEAIVINSKVPRPLACNAVETILVHEEWAKEHLKDLLVKLEESGIGLCGCEKAALLYPGIRPAEEKDWEEEYFAPFIAVKVVACLDEAITHINQYRTPHTESIITESMENAERFMAMAEANVVCHNAATRLTDGMEFGLGGEMGISTQKYPCGGPIGMHALMQQKYYLKGIGNLRK